MSDFVENDVVGETAACVRGRVVAKRYLAAVTAVSFVPYFLPVLSERYACICLCELCVCVW